MMDGLLIQYSFSGDEKAWNAAIEEFLGCIKKDTSLTGKFSYRVYKSRENDQHRFHLPLWDSEATLKHLQGQQWFKDFAVKVKGFAGETLKTTPWSQAYSSL